MTNSTMNEIYVNTIMTQATVFCLLFFLVTAAVSNNNMNYKVEI